MADLIFKNVLASDGKYYNLTVPSQGVAAPVAVAAPAPAPAPAPEPAPAPAPTSAWPDATNTGVPVGTTLTNSGSITTTAIGQVIDAKNVSGMITVEHNNVTVKRCKVTGSNYYQIYIKENVTGCIVEYCEIDNKSSGGQGINGQGTFRRNNIHHCSDGINVAGDNTLIEDNFIHNSAGTADSHIDAIQADGGFKNLTIRHNTIINENSQTAGIMLDNYWGPIDNVLIENNVVKGGGFTIYLNEANDQADKVTNVRVLNNRLGKGYWGYFDVRANAGFVPTLSGNVDFTTGAAVNG